MRAASRVLLRLHASLVLRIVRDACRRLAAAEPSRPEGDPIRTAFSPVRRTIGGLRCARALPTRDRWAERPALNGNRDDARQGLDGAGIDARGPRSLDQRAR